MGIPYLSAEWADEITRAANADPEFLAALRGRAASMTTTVIGAPSGGEVVYVMASTGRRSTSAWAPPTSRPTRSSAPRTRSPSGWRTARSPRRGR